MSNNFTTGHIVTAAEYDADVSRLGAWTSGINTAAVTTTGTTFAAGADLLVSALSITADGTSRYLVRVRASTWTNSVTTAASQIRLNIDGADGGIIAAYTPATASNLMGLCAEGVTGVLSAGSHTINVRLMVTAASTGTVNAGLGGAAANLPLLVAVAVI